MKPAKPSIPAVSWRDGRPRYIPGPAHRKMGYKGLDLKTRAGEWMSFEQASAWSQKHHIEIERRRSAKALTGRMPPRPKAQLVTLAGIFEIFFAQDRMKGQESRNGRRVQKPLAVATVRDYKQKRDVIMQDHPDFYSAPIAAIDKPIIYGVYESITAKRGVATGAAVVRVLSAAIAYGMRRGLCPFQINPCSCLGVETPPPRLRVAEPNEFMALINAADALDRPEIGDAIMLGVWTGQRQSDRLSMVDAGLINGRRILRQQKTGRLVSIPQSKLLDESLAAARARRSTEKLQHREIVIDERQNRPWKSQHYSHVFLAIRIVATRGLFERDGVKICPVEGIEAKAIRRLWQGIRSLTKAEAKTWPAGRPTEWIIEPMAELDGFRDQDLRDTAVTWLARAGCTLPEICSITGHAHESAAQIWKHYLAMHPELADHAIAKLEIWYENNTGTHETQETRETISRRLLFPARSHAETAKPLK